ncbi:MAG: CDP-glycerol glycerophosphotransferase family protein [Eubacteriales bacterium]|nr:CDP-glycerol glycerophosphotransferase family protein [Eubacteriales bacterium]
MKISVIIPVYNVEKYLAETLCSIQKQTLTDYEVIMVNDGSSDNSQKIMDQFCQEDVRFKGYKKENEGVSAARNYGLDRAAGEYVLFVDGDDLIPRKTMEIMYRKAKEKNADMVVGAMQEFGIYGKPVYAKTMDLANKEIIDKYDPLMLHTFSTCNKLLRMEIIRKNGLRFERIRHAEDGLFLFEFLYRCKTVAGCQEVVYKYRKRAFWEEGSATQSASESHLADLLYAVDRIVEMAREQKKIQIEQAEEKGNDGFLYVEQTKCLFEIYLSELHARIIEISLVNGYYRQIWKRDDAVLEMIKERVDYYKQSLFPDMWQRIVDANPDLRLERGLLTKAELLAEPLVTVGISDRVPEECVENVVKSIFNQSMPAFVLFIHGKFKGQISENFLDKECVVLCDEAMDTAAFKNAVLQRAASPYINFIDEPVYMNTKTYRRLYPVMEKVDYIDFASCELRLLDGTEKARRCHAHDIMFFEEYLPVKTKTMYHAVDWMSGNKLFRVQALRDKKFVFTNYPETDIAQCYRKFRFKPADKITTFTTLTEDEILGRVKDWRVKLAWKRRYDRQMSKTPREIEKKQKNRQDKIWAVKRFVIKMIPVQKKVLFVSVRGNKLLENSKAVYDAYDGKKLVFAHMYPHSKKQQLWLYWHMFSSKVIVTDDYFRYFRKFRLKPKQKIIQIWHACGAFKKFGVDNPAADIVTELKTHAQYDTVAVSSEAIRSKYAGAFGIDVEKVKALGTPRTDKLLDKAYLALEKEAFFKKFPALSGKKIILYAPTFRESAGKRVVFHPGLDWTKVSCRLGKDCVLIVKNHPVMKYDLLEGQKFDNIINMPKEETSRLMIVCDVIMTDYSSVIFESALLNKPAVFYCPDFDSYERDFYLDFPEDLYGELTTNQEELLDALERALESPDLPKLEAFKETYMGMCDGHSAERIAELIKQKLTED